MNASLAFELVLLARMEDDYQRHVLDQAGLTLADSERIRAMSPLQYPSMFLTSAEAFDQLLPSAHDSAPGSARRSRQFLGSEPRAYSLQLWSDFVWVIHVGSDGRIWGGEFQELSPRKLASAQLSALMAGSTCRHTLERVADKAIVQDGWDEWAVLDFEIFGQIYRGEFIYGLVQLWKKSPTTAAC